MILTEDHDIRDSGAPTADAAVIFDLRNYARHQSVFVTLTVSSVGGLYPSGLPHRWGRYEKRC
jgi:hypothetical protein